MQFGRLRSTLVMLMVAGCATVPEAELTGYRTAFQQAHTASEEVVNAFAPYERRNGFTHFENPDNVQPDDLPLSRASAIYYASIGRPPLAEAVLRGFEVIAKYNEVLALYAEGRSFEAIAPHVNRLTSALDGLIGLGGAVVGTPVTTAVVTGLVTPAQTILAELRSVQDRKRFAAFLDATHEDAIALIEAERDASVSLLRQAVAAIQATETDIDKEDRLVGEHRRAIANYMVLLDEVEQAYRNLVTASKSGSMTGIDIATLARSTDQLRASADKVRAAVIAAAGVV